MKLFKVAAVAMFAFAAVPAVAHADDFEAQCTATDKSDASVKSCKCVSEKLTGADRSAALDAMKAMNTALASGKPEDAAEATQKNAKGLEILMTAQMACM